MRRVGMLLVGILISAAGARAQIGKSVSVSAGTPEDKALGEIYAATDPAQKLQLLDKFMSEFGKGDLEMLGDQIYASTYLEQKNYNMAYEYAQKVLGLDADNFSAAVTLVHAAEGMKDASKMFDAAAQAVDILKRYEAAPRPEGTPEQQWEQDRDQNLENAKGDVSYMQYALYQAAFGATDPAAKAGYFERLVTLFPDSPYALDAAEQSVFAYQQAQNFPKMIAAAQNILAAHPDDAGMLVLLADYWSDKGLDVDKAGANAQKALDVLGKATKPGNVTDEQWQQQVSVQKGVAYSALGQVDVIRGRNAQAVEAFKEANPLLKTVPYYYGRNLYRLGFTLAKMQRIPEAKDALNQAIAVNSPYRGLAQQTLDKIGGAPPRRTKH
ncbi:MAG: tetratricopeptide repeat protein [Candidatus Acidiferrales bacterium]